MTSTLMPQAPTEARVGGVLPVRTLEAAQAHTQHKARKKQRKLDWLLFFLSWCEGCRSYGNSV